MLIEALAKLADASGAERIGLEISPTNGGACSVLVVPRFGQGARTSEDEKHGKLLEALTRPLVVRGHAAELDDKLVKLVDELEEGLADAAKMLPETEAQKRLKELSAAKNPAAKSEDKKEASKKTVDEEGDDKAQALADGNADSL